MSLIKYNWDGLTLNCSPELIKTSQGYISLQDLQAIPELHQFSPHKLLFSNTQGRLSALLYGEVGTNKIVKDFDNETVLAGNIIYNLRALITQTKEEKITC